MDNPLSFAVYAVSVSIQINLIDKPAAWLAGNDFDFASIKGDVSPLGKGCPR